MDADQRVDLRLSLAAEAAQAEVEVAAVIVREEQAVPAAVEAGRLAAQAMAQALVEAPGVAQAAVPRKAALNDRLKSCP